MIIKNEFLEKKLFNINLILCLLILTLYLLVNFKLYLLFFTILLIGSPLIFFGKEKYKYHGIESQRNSRLGGLFIILSLVLIYFTSDMISSENIIINNLNFYIIILLAISLLGLVDDVLGGVGNLIRLYFNIFGIVILLYTNQDFIFEYTKIEFVNVILQNNIIKSILTIFIIVGFINAANMADGANGILSGISAVVFIIFYYETTNLIYFALFEITFFFLIYNLFIGKVHLGDAGSYFLGFAIATNALYYYNLSLISAGLLATLLCYPSLEILMTISRRLIKLKNPLLPDNNHLHNIIHNKIKNKKFLILNSNSFTGIIVLCIFSIPGLALYLYLGSSFSIFYWIVFVIQFLLYIFIFNYYKN